MMTTITVGGPILALCGCCVKHGPDDRPLLWQVVTCRECGAACSCEGCVAEAEDAAAPFPEAGRARTDQSEHERGPLMKKLAPALILVVAFAGCGTAADTVSKNISTEAENFQVGRHIVVTSGITDKVLYDITGRCSWETPDVRTLEVTCLDDKAKGQYTKATIGLGDQDNWASVQLGSIRVNSYRTKIIIRPTSIVPDLDLVTGEQG